MLISLVNQPQSQPGLQNFVAGHCPMLRRTLASAYRTSLTSCPAGRFLPNELPRPMARLFFGPAFDAARATPPGKPSLPAEAGRACRPERQPAVLRGGRDDLRGVRRPTSRRGG